MTREKRKSFDAVQLMRQIRDQMSAEMTGMSYEEQARYIEDRASTMREELKGRSKHKAA